MKKTITFLALLLLAFSYPLYLYFFQEVKVYTLNTNLEYQEGWDTYRIYKHTSNILGDKKLIINWNEVRADDIEVEKKISYKEAETYFKNFFDYKDLYKIEDWKYITYFSEYRLSFEEGDGFYPTELKALGINPEEDILFKEDDTYFFSETDDKIELVSVSTLEDIKEKDIFLEHLRDDFIKNPDTKNKDFLVKSLIGKAQSITKGITDKEGQIKATYDWIVDNLTYNLEDINDKRIFSWLETYKRKEWVCDGYTKLFVYFLTALWHNNVERIPGTVLDSEDFGVIGHAWVRIGDSYYDPTFENTGLQDEHNGYYYQLPRDVFYADRIETLEIPEELINTTSLERDAIILNNYKNILKKYNYTDYKVLEYYALRNSVTKGQIKQLSIQDLVNYYWWSELKSGIVNYQWKNYRIKQYSYLPLKEENSYLESILKHVGKWPALIIKEGSSYSIFFNLELVSL